jgi:hypothetical protein
MLRIQADVAVLVFALVVVAERVAPRFSGRFIEPATREDAPDGLNLSHRRAGALVLDDIDIEAAIGQVVLKTFAGEIIGHDTVVR